MARILVVDDDTCILALVRRILIAAGHSVEFTDHGSAVVALVDSFRPDLIVTDIFMPEVDGLEVIRLVRAFDNSIRIIVMSGNHLELLSRYGHPGWPYYLRAAQCMGANSALRKPFSPEELLAAIASEMKRRPSLKAARQLRK